MPVKIAYLILAYNKPDQLLRLVCRLHGGDTYFFIHIDKRTRESVYLQCVAALGPFRNVHFIRRYASPWGGFGIVSGGPGGRSRGLPEADTRRLSSSAYGPGLPD